MEKVEHLEKLNNDILIFYLKIKIKSTINKNIFFIISSSTKK